MDSLDTPQSSQEVVDDVANEVQPEEQSDLIIDDEDTVVTDLDLPQCSRELSEYFKIDTTAQVRELDEQIEEMLKHMQELCGHLGKVQSDTNFVLQQKIPEMHSRAMQLRAMYQQIDDIEAFMGVVSKNVTEFEESVANAEKLFGSNAISRVLKGFSKPSFLSGLGSKSKVVPSPTAQGSRFDAPPVFSTDEYFPASPPSNDLAAATGDYSEDA